MLQFFKSRKFKAFITVICALLLGAVLAVASAKGTSPITNVIGSLLSPVQKLTSYVADNVHWFSSSFESAGSYKNEIERLKQQIAEYENQLVDYNDLQKKLSSYETMLGVKEENPDFALERAGIIGTDAADMFTSLIIDKGSKDGVSVNDPAVYGNYVVGIVKKVHPYYSVVKTILNPELNISALDSKTRETAYVTTTIDFSSKGHCVFLGLERTTGVSPGGIILTSGIGGIYPKGLIIGTVNEVCESEYDLSNYAVIEPGVNVKEIEDLYIITEFDGQGIEEIID